MPPPLLFDPSQYDASARYLTKSQIYGNILPHQAEFEQLDYVATIDFEELRIVGGRSVRTDEWWAAGHIPGRPIFPGVLVLETAAHLASVLYKCATNKVEFMAFGGVDGVKFRDAIYPPAELLFLGHATEVKARRMICDVQALVGDKLVFTGCITGLMMSL